MVDKPITVGDKAITVGDKAITVEDKTIPVEEAISGDAIADNRTLANGMKEAYK